MARRLAALLASIMIASIAASPATGSALVTRDATNVRLVVDGRGRALVTYRTPSGILKRALVWNAVDARTPTAGVPQVEFSIDYTGGIGVFKWPVWKTFRGRCAPYDGPPLSWLVQACKAPDGSYWALQSWQRVRPFHGKPPSKRFHDSWELRISHWTGDLAKLEVWREWRYSARFESITGRVTYRGVPVHNPARGSSGWQSYVRRAYIDTHNSGYGPGWWRADAFAAHPPTGVFCAIFAKELTDRFGTNRGAGERYRVTFVGPGVTPDVTWEGASLGPWNPNDPAKVHEEERVNAIIRSLGERDPRCAEP